MADLSYNEYWKEINSLAETIVEECISDTGMDPADLDMDSLEDCAYERIWETVDGHQWIIYYAYNPDVIKHSANEGAHEDMGGSELFAGKSYNEIGTIVAFYAMESDLSNAVGNYIRNLE